MELEDVYNSEIDLEWEVNVFKDNKKAETISDGKQKIKLIEKDNKFKWLNDNEYQLSKDKDNFKIYKYHSISLLPNIELQIYDEILLKNWFDDEKSNILQSETLRYVKG